MYGKKIKNYAFANHRSKKIFNSKFGSILCKLELRLNVLLVRIGFVDKLLKASSLILTGKIKINNIRKNKRYVISSNDLISSSPAYLKINNVKRFKKLRWRRLK
jgi:ribosomal protein S4